MSMGTPHSEEQAHRDAGDGVEVTVTEARGSQRTGRAVWILVISTVLAVVLLGGYFALHARGLHDAEASSGTTHAQGVTNQAALFNTTPSSPKQAPPGEASTSGATPSETTPSNTAH